MVVTAAARPARPYRLSGPHIIRKGVVFRYEAVEADRASVKLCAFLNVVFFLLVHPAKHSFIHECR